MKIKPISQARLEKLIQLAQYDTTYPLIELHSAELSNILGELEQFREIAHYDPEEHTQTIAISHQWRILMLRLIEACKKTQLYIGKDMRGDASFQDAQEAQKSLHDALKITDEFCTQPETHDPPQLDITGRIVKLLKKAADIKLWIKIMKIYRKWRP